MNIFYLHKDPKVCAEMHNDKHTIKMILEYAQLLSTAHRLLDGTPHLTKSKTGRNVVRYILPESRENTLYSATHINHPSAIWARKNVSNYNYLYSLFICLCKEYEYRYGKTHLCYTKLAKQLSVPPHNIPKGEFTEPTPAMPDDVKVAGNSVESYRNYYINNKQHLATWNGKLNSRPIPEWFHANV